MWFLWLSLLLGQQPAEPFTSPANPTSEYGRALTAEEARAGWISLFDGSTEYGWDQAKVDQSSLTAGTTTGVIPIGEVRADVLSPGTLKTGELAVELKEGTSAFELDSPSRLMLNPPLRLKSLCLKPSDLKPVWNQRDLSGCTVLRHPRLADDKQARWSVQEKALCALGGPGAVELEGRYGDFVLQVEVRTRQKLVNGGVFFRSIPGQFMNGYEAQLFNGCYQKDPGRPARYSTGAIDDRLLARRLVSRDLEPFTMTVIAVGPHIATWVNGYQTVDWTDTRTPHENPREGKRVEPGTIQLQAHDPETDIEFRRVEIRAVEKP